jgi:hypothetical protein
LNEASVVDDEYRDSTHKRIINLFIHMRVLFVGWRVRMSKDERAMIGRARHHCEIAVDDVGRVHRELVPSACYSAHCLGNFCGQYVPFGNARSAFPNTETRFDRDNAILAVSDPSPEPEHAVSGASVAV